MRIGVEKCESVFDDVIFRDSAKYYLGTTNNVNYIKCNNCGAGLIYGPNKEYYVDTYWKYGAGTITDKMIYKGYPVTSKVGAQSVIDVQNLLYGNGAINTVTTDEIEIPFIKPVTLTLNKEDFDGTIVPGAKFNITGVNNVNSITDSNNNSINSITIGSSSIKITPANGNSGTFRIKLKETTVPTGYQGVLGEILLKVTYDDGEVTQIKQITEDGVEINSDYIVTRISNNKGNITIKNTPEVNLIINKIDSLHKDAQGNPIKLANAMFKIELTNVESIRNYEVPTLLGDVNRDGEITIEDAQLIQQYSAGMIELDEDKRLRADFDSNGVINTADATEIQKYLAYKLEPKGLGDINNDGKIDMKDSLLIQEHLATILELSDDQKSRADVNGDGEINIKDSTKIQAYIVYKIVYVKSAEDGVIKLEGIVPKGKKENKITVRITEVGVPEVPSGEYYYKILKEPIEIEFEYVDGQWKKVSGDITITNFNNVNLQIENQPYIRLSGMVWQDAQQGEKVVDGPDGIKNEYDKYNKVDQGQGEYQAEYDENGNFKEFKYVGQGEGNYKKETVTESGLAGVLVGLYSEKENRIVLEEGLEPRLTDENGKYEFKDIPKTNEGYRIVFSYDGINWQETNSIRKATGGDSDATEIDDDRTAFNNKFKTISKGIARATNGETIPLSYEYDSENDKSTLRAGINGTNPAKGDAMDFQMKAQTGTYLRTTSNIDCGLVKKEFDLAIGTDVKKATLKINDKETTYTHQQIINGELNDLELDNILQNNSATSNEDVKYNLYLYASDYNYRIDDYKTGITNKVDSEEYKYEEDTSLEELEAYVTYSVMLKNQTTYSAIVDEFVYYYDDVYTPHNIVSTDKYAVSIDETNRKITFTNLDGGLTLNAPNYNVEIELTFKVNKDANGNIITKTATNVAEITRYSTHEGGLIDKDSAPDNGITNGQITQYEDDTDEAKGIDISVRDKETRTISGIVFNDTYKNTTKTEYDKDGNLNNENTAVNDVIVQLIEIKEITINNKTQYYEYIWQETRSGQNQVKTTARNGYKGTGYTNSVKEDEKGRYEFKDFIPGNYIIRFIYGDGSTYDLTENVQTYNGQDYKSTKDVNYTEQFYNDVMYNSTSGKTNKYSENSSVARDNEARRLEVMSYSTMIDKDKGEKLANKTDEALANTWMAAETSTIKVPVDADDTSTTQDSTNVSYNNIGNTVSFANVNFGLALRPQTKLVLEKHITGLKITPNGTGVQPIIDAKANIGKIVEDGVIETTGVTEGLAPILSTRGNRGFWQVATDVEELTQGAALEVEYTYVLKNVSEEKDYLSSELVDEFETNLNNYSTYLQNIVKPGEGNLKNTLRGNTHKYGEYLGQYYYNGNSAGCKEVSSRIETVEEAINNDLKFEESEYFTKVNTDVVSKNVYDTNGALATENINTVLQTKDASEFITPNEKDYSKKITLKTTLTSVTGGELGANIPSYIAEITTYTNAAGRRDMNSEPANLSYVHSEDTDMTLSNSWLYEVDGKTYETQNKETIPEGASNIREANEPDEFWGETIIITKPTGEDRITPIQIILTTISALAVLGVGIILIKKIALKK